MITVETALAYVRSLAALPFFPTDESARGAIAADLASYASTEEQLRNLKTLIFRFWHKWQGPAELRAAFCALYPPRDGCNTFSALYPEGYPALDPKLDRLSLNMHAIDALPPTERELLDWRQQHGAPDIEFSRKLLAAALESTSRKLLLGRSDPYTAEEIRNFERERESRLEDAIRRLAEAARAAAIAGVSEERLTDSDIELDRAGMRELFGAKGITREQARDAVTSLSDLPGYAPEVAEALADSLCSRAPDMERAAAAVAAIRRNWPYLLRAVGGGRQEGLLCRSNSIAGAIGPR